MVCHMHQPNVFVNSFMGTPCGTMESDAPAMWPEKQKYPTADEIKEVYQRNPEGAAAAWEMAEVNFLEHVK